MAVLTVGTGEQFSTLTAANSAASAGVYEARLMRLVKTLADILDGVR